MRKHAQLVLAVSMASFGAVLILTAFFVPPLGVIDPTVLTAFGEILTFSGSLIGIDYKYRYMRPTSGDRSS
jgi:hypothetical protein